MIMKKIFTISFLNLLTVLCPAQDPLYLTDSNLPCLHRTFYPYVFIGRDSLENPVISLEELDDLFARLNKVFEPVCISFEYCNLEYIMDYSFLHINDDVEINLLTTRFRKKRRINIFITESVINEKINSFSIHNGITNPLGAVIIIPKSGAGLMHEMGHTFGLYHTFEDDFGLELVDQSNCEVAGDLICDTPAMPDYVYPDKYCQYLSDAKDGNGDYYKPEIGNFMTHFFCAHCFFTKEQYITMVKNYVNSPFKMW